MAYYIVFLCISVIFGQGRAGAPVQLPDQCPWGSAGICGGFIPRECPLGSTCVRPLPSSATGQCCLDKPLTPACQYGSSGTCGGFVGQQCKSGYTCKYRPNSDLGDCCKNSAVDVCPFGQDGMCGGIAGFMCRKGTTCMFMANFPDAAGKCCIDSPSKGVCPKSSGLVGICLFDPKRNCLSDASCPKGHLCCSEGCGKICKPAITY